MPKKKKKGRTPPPPKQQTNQPKAKPKGRQVPAATQKPVSAPKPPAPAPVELPETADAPAAAPPPPPPREIDPHQQALEQRWEEFRALEDYEEQIAMFRATLDDGLMDEENAFEMLNTIYSKSIDHNDHEPYIELINLLREREPELYENDSQYYIANLINIAIVTGQTEPLPTLVEEMTEQAEAAIDDFLNMIDKLLYHGYGDLAANAMRKAWPAIKESQDILNPRRIGYQAVDVIMHAYLDNTEHPDGNDPQLLENLADITDTPVVPEKLARYIELAHGENLPQWSMSDFDLPRKGQKGYKKTKNEEEDDQLTDSPRNNLYELTVAFLSYLRHTENVPYVKGYLVRESIDLYILDRLAGDIKPRQPMLLHPKQQPAPKPPDVPSPSQIEHILCPDGVTIELFSDRFFGFMSVDFHRFAALLELLPAWLRFLETLQLLDAEQHARATQDLRSKIVVSAHTWTNREDKIMGANVRNVWEITDEDVAASRAAAEKQLEEQMSNLM